MARKTIDQLILWRADKAKEDNRFARAAPLSTLNASDRTVDSVLTTEDPVNIYDWRQGRVVLEVLLVDGCEYEDQTPLLRDHSQYSVTAILGSVLNASIKNDELLGTLQFGKDLDEPSESIWRRVEQKHLRRVSIGYDYSVADFVTLEPGETKVVKGRSFTAPKDKALRIVFRWRLREVSMVVIPADARAQLRGTQVNGQQEFNDSTETLLVGTTEENMKKTLQLLRSFGLAENLEIADGLRWASERANMTDSQYARFEATAKEEELTIIPRAQAESTTTRTNPPPLPDTTNTLPVDAQRVANEAIVSERNRVAQIRQLAEQHATVPRTVADQAIERGLTIEQTRAEFLTAIRSAPEGAPAVHLRAQTDVRSLQAALLYRAGFTPDSPILNTPQAHGLTSRAELNCGWLVGCSSTGERRNQLEQAFEVVHQRSLQGLSMIRLCQEIVELSGQRAPYNNDELLQRAFANAQFTQVLGAVTHFRMLDGYVRTSTNYSRFCEVIDVPDFRKNDEAMFNGVGGLKRQAKNGGQAATLNIEDPTLSSVAAERYAGMLELTDQILIGNNFDAIMRMAAAIGEAAGAIPTELAWMQLLSTGNLTDGRQRFNTTDGNLLQAFTFDSTGFEAAGKKLKAKKVNGKRIQIDGGLVIAGTTTSTRCGIILNSQTLDNKNNPHFRSYELMEDTAVDLGCTDVTADPETDIAGMPTSIFMLAKPAKSITVAFREGTNRGPISRRKDLTDGKWGIGWDVYVDVGSAFRTRVGIIRCDV